MNEAIFSPFFHNEGNQTERFRTDRTVRLKIWRLVVAQSFRIQ
jgi:hypothetical protein